jgi:hypothetical protein
MTAAMLKLASAEQYQIANNARLPILRNENTSQEGGVGSVRELLPARRARL